MINVSNLPFDDSVTLTEVEPEGFAAAGWLLSGGSEQGVVVPRKFDDLNSLVLPPPAANDEELTIDQETRDRIKTALEADNTTITVANSPMITYSVEKEWGIAFADKDRPDEITVVLQRQDSCRKWKTMDMIKLNPANNWSG